MQEISIIQPDDWHIHLRDGAALQQTVADASRYFSRAIIMPNLTPPVVNAAQALEYRQRILDQVPAGRKWNPLMVLYLTNNTTRQDIVDAYHCDHVYAAKLYPAGATTNSDSGVTELERLAPVFETMQELGLPLLIHGEVTDPAIDIFDREAEFIARCLKPLLQRYPTLKVVLEHITTAEAASFVAAAGDNVAATITAHHLLYNRNHLLAGGIRPHYYCLPILKRSRHQQALLNAATSGNRKFFLGTDSAPHLRNAKEAACGCAGCYTAYAAIELYAEAFAAVGALDKLEGFASLHGPAFYDLPINKRSLRLYQSDWPAPQKLTMGGEALVPLRAGESLQWRAELKS
jgi:dihydroorotase